MGRQAGAGVSLGAKNTPESVHVPKYYPELHQRSPWTHLMWTTGAPVCSLRTGTPDPAGVGSKAPTSLPRPAATEACPLEE